MSRVGAVVLAAGLLLASIPIAAGALCMQPRPFFAPGDGTRLPRNPTVFFFVPGGTGYEFDVRDGQGEAVPFRVRREPAGERDRVWVLAIAIEEGTVWIAASSQLGPTFAEYPVGPVAPPDRAPVRVTDVTLETRRWSCSFKSVHTLALSTPAPAYRLEWATSEEAYRRGARSAIILPRSRDLSFGAARPPELHIGHVDCRGWNLRQSGAIWVGVTALHADGRTSPPAGDPVRVEAPPEREVIDPSRPPGERG